MKDQCRGEPHPNAWNYRFRRMNREMTEKMGIVPCGFSKTSTPNSNQVGIASSWKQRDWFIAARFLRSKANPARQKLQSG